MNVPRLASLAASALAALALAACGASAAVVVDGRLDPDYGSPLSIQTTQTVVGDDNYAKVDGANGSELDQAFGFVSNGTLYLFIGGNLYQDWVGPDLETAHANLALLFDTQAGGQNPMRSDNPSVEGLNQLAGLRFDSDFTPDYWIGFHGDHWPIGPYQSVVSYAQLPAGGGGAAYVVGFGATGAPGTLSGGTNPFGLLASIDNSNSAGVTAGCGAASGFGVGSGIELAIPLAALGNPVGCFKVCALVHSPYAADISNQVLGPVPAGTCDLGNPAAVDFSAIPGSQYFTVCSLATPARMSSWGRVKVLYR